MTFNIAATPKNIIIVGLQSAPGERQLNRNGRFENPGINQPKPNNIPLIQPPPTCWLTFLGSYNYLNFQHPAMINKIMLIAIQIFALAW
jgi:hypothetical protein